MNATATAWPVNVVRLVFFVLLLLFRLEFMLGLNGSTQLEPNL